jgi:inner membrane protein
MEQKQLLWKAGVVAALAIGLMIPLAMIQGAVAERRALHDDVVANIASSTSGPQKILAPVLVIPYRERITRTVTEARTGTTREQVKVVDGTVTLLPARLEVAGAAATEERYRGIHKALLYRSSLSFKGSFDIPAGFGLKPEGTVSWGTPYLAVGVSDIRGIKSRPILTWQGRGTPFQPGTRDGLLSSGLHAPLAALPPDAASYEFSFELDLQGTDRLDIVPAGRETTVRLHSAWPHPSFIGRFLPEQRAVSDSGFDATWRSSYFSTDIEQLWRQCGYRECPQLLQSSLGVAFIEPVDIYLKTERAVKYGVLFIGLTFAAFFLFELFKRLAIHPIQYGLVGIALAVFFLMLLSLSEHLSFGVSYLAAASACIGLLSVYAAYVLRGMWRASGFAALLVGLYGALYVLLQLEDFALLMGSLLLFAIVAALMLGTRKVDWYRLGKDENATGPV